MKYLSIYHSEPRPMSAAQQAEMGQLMAETMKSGALVLTGGIQPVAKGGARVRNAGGEITVDGPFTEAREVVGGFAIVEAKTREEAIEMTKRFIRIAGEGECELHAIHEPGGPR